MEGQTLFNVGLFYERNKQYELMKQYYLMAIELNNSNAMFNLGVYYGDIEINYELMKKYYLMAIELGDMKSIMLLTWKCYIYSRRYELLKKLLLIVINLNNKYSCEAFNQLAHYYHIVEHNDELTIFYYTEAIKLNDTNAMCNLACYYKYQQKYELMKKYCLMAINLNNAAAMIQLGYYYMETEHNYKLMNKYCLMSLEYGYISGYNKLLEYYTYNNNVKWIYYLLYEINKDNKFNITYDYDYDLKPFIEYRTNILNNVSNLIKLLYRKKINRFIFKHSRNYLYNPINGRLFIKRIVNKYT